MSGSPFMAAIASARCWRRVGALAAAWCVAGGSAGLMLDGAVAAVAGLIAAALSCAVITVMLSAILGRREPCSPFTRLMLIICVITGRLPETICLRGPSGHRAAISRVRQGPAAALAGLGAR